MPKLVTEEQLLLGDIFLIKIIKEDIKQNLMYLEGFAKDLRLVSGDEISLVKNDTLFDSLLMERLGMNNTNPLQYLYESFLRAADAKGKAWNQQENYQNFINYSMQIILNFAHLALSNPEMFPYQFTDPEILQETDDIKSAAQKLYKMIRSSLNESFIFPLIGKFSDQEQNQICKIILINLLTDHKSVLIYEDNAIKNVEIILKLIQHPKFKYMLFNIEPYPWVPGPGNINLKKGIGSALGNNLEANSPLGIILKPSFLPPLKENPKDKENYSKILEKVHEVIGKDRKTGQRLQESYMNLQNEYIQYVAEIFKTLVKPGKEMNYKTETIRWLSALLVGNISRTKLGLRLEQENKKLKTNSSDALSLNVFDLMLQICSKFLEEDKYLLEKVDPRYYINGWKFDYSETPLINKPGVVIEDNIIDKKTNEEYGTISEFLFHCVEYAHVMFIPIIQNCVESRQVIQRLKSSLEKMDPNTPLAKQFDKELKLQEKIFLSYHCILMDKKRINKLHNLYDNLLNLLLKWSNINPESIQDGTIPKYKPRILLKYLPEHWITDLFEYHFFYFRTKDKYSKELCASPYLNNIITFLCVILSDIEFVSNPYTKAKIVELISFCCYGNDDILIVFDNNKIAVRNLMRLLIKFYIDIEFTGASNQFYAKYQYRHHIASIFKKLWKLEKYQKALVDISRTEIFERFINMIMNDTTYCMDEGLQKIFKVLEFYNKKNEGKQLDPEEEKTFEQYEGLCRSVFMNARNTIKIMANISGWAPNAFFFGDFRKRLSCMENYFISELISPKLINLDVKKAKDLKLKPRSLLRELIKIYVNLSDDEEFCKSVVQDERSYNPDNLKKALLKVQNQKSLPGSIVEKFQHFINKMQNISIENEDITAKLGEIPEEFMCPISCDLMKEPVLLPTSGNIMEKSVIKQSLLNDEHDPFNRAPLKFSQVQDLPELKKKIEDWIKSRLSGIKSEPKPNTSSKIIERMEEEEKVEEKDDFDPFAWNDKKYR